MSHDEAFDSSDAAHCVPLRLDYLLTSHPQTHVINEVASNRAPAESCAIDAKDDLEAINAWLLEHRESGPTLRSYRKEIERFYNWLVLIQHKSIGGVTPDDIDAYDLFMRAPPDTWCGPRYGRRKTERWRPYEDALSAKSRSQAKIILRACFSYLVAVRYVLGNPIPLERPTRKRAVGERIDSLRESHIPPPALRKLIQALEQQAAASPFQSARSIATAERHLFVVRFLLNTGLRGEELAKADMFDIACEKQPSTHRSYWTMSVGRGEAFPRKIAVNSTALEALRRYRQVYETDDSFWGESSPVLLPLSGRRTPPGYLSAQTVYAISMDALKIASLHYASSDVQTSALFAKATPHWFRTTFAAIAAQCGIAQNVIQKQIGIASLQQSVAKYRDVDPIELLDMVAKLKL
ncbi:site-specific integrase [Paraburkholderia dipogonis]|uniref:Site-specific integrase n=2 Tax=Paraburkholderia dipogonis TaxID=1211383 RepID=A0A4Y8MVP3_9BURK|nr:site-specific integrase [Paraburkholderia dipogonis]TFE41531.1 site-specific integrase [Paraburkholderia dipogonis]